MHGIDEGLTFEIGMQCHAQQTVVPGGSHLYLGVELRLVHSFWYALNPAGSLGNQGISVGKEFQRPGDLEILDPGFDLDPFHIGQEVVGHRLRNLSHDRLRFDAGDSAHQQDYSSVEYRDWNLQSSLRHLAAPRLHILSY